MRAAAVFLGAALLWLTSLDENGANEVIQRLNQTLRSTDLNLEIVFRPDQVLNVRHKWVAAAAEPLTRWDNRDPTEIFRGGFKPQLTPGSLNEFRALNDGQVNIQTFVIDNSPSIFVSTTRYATHEGKLAHWSPVNVTGRYEYEIFAYGGVDVNFSLRLEDNPSADQQEVAFPGGIRPGLIRSARQYNDTGYIVRVWHNLGFNPLLNNETVPRVIDLLLLPNVVGASNFMLVDPTDDDEKVSGHNNQRRRDETANEDTDANNGNMKGYVLAADAWAADNVSVFPLGRASMLVASSHKSNKATTYFFADTRLVPIDLDLNNNLADTISAGGVQNIIDAQPALHKAHFTQVDAVLPNPQNNDEAYFFSKDKYVLVNLKTNATIGSPAMIFDAWPSLRKAGFATIDAALPNYNNNGQAYISSGKNYVRIKIDPSSNAILTGPTKIVNGWKSLAKAGFDSVDAVLPSPRKAGETYFFKDDKYVRISFFWAASTEHLEVGPSFVKDASPSLAQAKFY